MKRKLEILLDGKPIMGQELDLSIDNLEKMFDKIHYDILGATDITEFYTPMSPPFLGKLKEEYERLGGNGKAPIIHPDYPHFRFTQYGWSSRRWIREPYTKN